MEKSFATWINERGIGEVECLIPDLNGVIRGKVFPAQKFLQSERDGSLRIPSSIYLLTVTGEYADEADEAIDRKSTRLNSSHVKISYAVFCLKKKTYATTLTRPSKHTS